MAKAKKLPRDRRLDHESDEQTLDIPELMLMVHVERREKLVCKVCRGDAVTAARAEAPVSRPVGASGLAHLVESKCDDALPIHRQRDQFSRLGFEVRPTRSIRTGRM